jgi:hypothetical protein
MNSFLITGSCCGSPGCHKGIIPWLVSVALHDSKTLEIHGLILVLEITWHPGLSSSECWRWWLSHDDPWESTID